MRVGFIGLGSMGGDQARCLVASGFDLTVFDVFAPSQERFAGKARLASSIADLGHDADIVGVCVRDDQQVCEALEGPQGLIANMAQGSIILIHSTVNPATVHSLARSAAERRIDLLDAAVSRTAFNTPGPFVCAIVGGDEAVLDRARPVLDAYATDVIHAGALGAGMALKITNNMVTWSSIVTVAQAFRLAIAGGVDTKALHALMTRNGNLTPVTKAFSEKFLGKERDKAFMESQAGIGEKDMSLAAEFARSVGVDIPIADQVRGGIRGAMTDNYG